MRTANGCASASMRPDDRFGTGPKDRNDARRFCGTLPGDRRRALRHGEPWMASVVPTAGHTHENEGTVSGGRQRAPGTRRSDGGALGTGGGGGGPEGLRFDVNVAPGGYAWWYADGLSDDGAHGFTVIAFIGSVFSPYYAWSERRSPFNHCAVNVALYGPRANRWAMTERTSGRVTAATSFLQIGPSTLTINNETLNIEIDEFAAPIPRKLKGVIRIHMHAIGKRVFTIDAHERHRWRPLAPWARVEVEFSQPSLQWSGEGYVDANDGDEPLEDAFSYWDWSRTHLGGGDAAVLYNTDTRSGDARSLALRFDKHGLAEAFDPPAVHMLGPTSVWRIKRRIRSEPSEAAQTVKTLEDTPFYSRSVIRHRLFGEDRLAMHEAFSGARLRAPIVKAMLPFRMPRY